MEIKYRPATLGLAVVGEGPRGVPTRPEVRLIGRIEKPKKVGKKKRIDPNFIFLRRVEKRLFIFSTGAPVGRYSIVRLARGHPATLGPAVVGEGP